MRKAYMYLRVSTAVQLEGYGLELQKDEIVKYAAENDIEIVGKYVDAGISGTVVERPALQDMLLAFEENPEIKYVITYSCSRLWRSEITGGLVRYELAKRNVDILSVTENNYSLYVNDPSEFLISQIMSALASYDRMQVNQKLLRGRSSKAKSGIKGCGTAPLGYSWTKEATIETDPIAASIVTDIFVQYVRLKSFGAVQKYCDEHGYHTQKGNNFSRQAIKNILSNQYYNGIVTFAGQEYKGTQPTFITTELFNEVQKIMGKPTKNRD
ncbi:MAG: recombinase family protein [Lachnospiraceae bacterium]|nr:recombinase family protein [Lachnospiraceae bacterium]